MNHLPIPVVFLVLGIVALAVKEFDLMPGSIVKQYETDEHATMHEVHHE